METLHPNEPPRVRDQSHRPNPRDSERDQPNRTNDVRPGFISRTGRDQLPWQDDGGNGHAGQTEWCDLPGKLRATAGHGLGWDPHPEEGKVEQPVPADDRGYEQESETDQASSPLICSAQR